MSRDFSYTSVTQWVKTSRAREVFFDSLSDRMKSLELKQKRKFFRQIKKLKDTPNPEDVYLADPINLTVGQACLFLLL